MKKAIAVDDENHCLNVIRQYVENIPFIELVATFNDGLEALHYLSNESVDLLFLDLNMPKISGVGVLEKLDKKPLVILITAETSSTVRNLNLDIDACLYKPYTFDQFYKVCKRVII